MNPDSTWEVRKERVKAKGIGLYFLFDIWVTTIFTDAKLGWLQACSFGENSTDESYCAFGSQIDIRVDGLEDVLCPSFGFIERFPTRDLRIYKDGTVRIVLVDTIGDMIIASFGKLDDLRQKYGFWSSNW